MRHKLTAARLTAFETMTIGDRGQEREWLRLVEKRKVSCDPPHRQFSTTNGNTKEKTHGFFAYMCFLYVKLVDEPPQSLNMPVLIPGSGPVTISMCSVSQNHPMINLARTSSLLATSKSFERRGCCWSEAMVPVRIRHDSHKTSTQSVLSFCG